MALLKTKLDEEQIYRGKESQFDRYIYQDKIYIQSLPSSTSSIPSSQLLSVSDVKQSAC